MKVLVIGDEGIGKQIATALSLHASHKQHDVVTINSLDDVEPNEGDVLICEDDSITPNQKQLALIGLPMSLLAEPSEVVLPKKDYSFRGGSRGKGGKIKYQRK